MQLAGGQCTHAATALISVEVEPSTYPSWLLEKGFIRALGAVDRFDVLAHASLTDHALQLATLVNFKIAKPLGESGCSA